MKKNHYFKNQIFKKYNKVFKIILLEQKQILENQKIITEKYKYLLKKQIEQDKLNKIIKYISLLFLLTRISLYYFY